MGEFKQIALKSLLLFLLLAGLNLLYKQFFFAQDCKDYSAVAEMFYSRIDTADILYFAESSEFTYADADIDKRSMTQFLHEYYPKQRIVPLAIGALHAGTFYDMLRQVPSDGPQTMIVTLNLRSFGAKWIHSNLETALQKEMTLLKPGPLLWRRLMLSLRNYEIKSKEEREADAGKQWTEDTLRFPQPFPYPTLDAWNDATADTADRRAHRETPLTKEDRVLACHYIKAYGYQIDTLSNVRIRDFDRIVALAQARGWQLILNLLPENVERAEQLVGPELVFLMRQNRDLLKKRYAQAPNVTFVDQLETLPNKEFRDQEWTGEHYLEMGRRSVVAQVALALDPLYPGEMQQPKIVRQIKRLFFNDCEGAEVWSQSHTIDETRAHSGKKSCHTGGEMGKFGLTFTHPMEMLDTNALDTLAISCWVYAAEIDTAAAFAWEAYGKNLPYTFEAIRLKRQLTGKPEWQHFQVRLPLPSQIKEADIFKAYPHNPNEIPIWFDDIRIEFIPKASPPEE